jgi:uncharacterized membrane protein
MLDTGLITICKSNKFCFQVFGYAFQVFGYAFQVFGYAFQVFGYAPFLDGKMLPQQLQLFKNY